MNIAIYEKRICQYLKLHIFDSVCTQTPPTLSHKEASLGPKPEIYTKEETKALRKMISFGNKEVKKTINREA